MQCWVFTVLLKVYSCTILCWACTRKPAAAALVMHLICCLCMPLDQLVG
jgi:hypothetical protein